VTAPLPDTYQSVLEALQLEQRLSSSYPRDVVHRQLGVPRTLEELVKSTGRAGRLPGGQRIQVGRRPLGWWCCAARAGWLLDRWCC
jgi:hypothetical protein